MNHRMKGLIPFVILIGLAVLAYTNQDKKSNDKEIDKLKAENERLRTTIKDKSSGMRKQFITSLTFQDNNAEKAMNFYIALFDNSRIIHINRWGKEAPVEEGRIMKATFELNGNLFMCSDSPAHHNWDFSPAVSKYIECDDEKEIERLYSKLSENGEVPMPLDNYGFSTKFAWVIDQFGVSWQLNLQ
ncbi:VOC family protein [Halosquirtibacter laminarini]|uniref:VOC family protein n=1 Tax=Halosquirtibacter laminarini TaxID=3374600 RepID=A0AC61NH76_9BACT|nr:VOC family protein [Prolixibacteraceae bacterium]